MMMDNIQDKDNTESSESQVSSPAGTVLNAPKFGIVVPNRVFVGGISSQTTENDLAQLFSSYGRVINTKIIADRAGVSKGYGFVTFETEEEAKRLQQDAESIILRERRLNIAPAIKKQGYQRPYDCMTPATESPVQMTSGQMYRQPGVPFFQNGMAFYAPVAAPTPQPTQPMTPIQSPVDGPQMYSPGAYGGVAQNTSAPNYTFSYQNPIYYQAPYPYHLALEGYPVSEGTQMAPNNVIVPAASIESGGVLFAASPYIFAQQPATQQPYFDPQNLSPMPPTTSQEAAPPQLFYSSARSYEPPTFVYAENRNQQPTTNGASPSALPAPQIPLAICDSTDGQEVALSGPQQRPEHPNFLQPEGSTRGRTPRGRGGRCNYARGGAFKPFPRPLQSYPKNYQNNNDPKCSDRNSYPNTTYVNRKYYGLYPPRSSRPPTYPESPAKHPYPNSYPNSSNHSPPQVPAVPYIPGVRPHYGILPFSPRRGGLASRGKYTGRGGKPLKSQTWTYSRDGSDIAEDGNALANALTPPITPRSPHDPSEDIAASLQGLNI